MSEQLKGNPDEHPPGSVGAGRDSRERVHLMDDEPDLIELLGRLLGHRQALLLIPSASTLLFLAVWLFASPVYRASTSFVPEPGGQRRLPASLSGIADQLGIPIG